MLRVILVIPMLVTIIWSTSQWSCASSLNNACSLAGAAKRQQKCPLGVIVTAYLDYESKACPDPGYDLDGSVGKPRANA